MYNILDNSLMIMAIIMVISVIYPIYSRYFKVHRNTITGEQLMLRYLQYRMILANREYNRKVRNESR
jgi:hypothetical protein